MKEVIFLGHHVSERGIAPYPEEVKAIKNMRPPINKSELKSFLGMVNFLSKFSCKLTEMEKPLRELQQKTSEWVWDCAKQESFERVKEKITRAPVLTKYDLRARHRITADSSSYATGAVLLQMDQERRWQLIMFISRRLPEAEKRYAQIGKEA